MEQSDRVATAPPSRGWFYLHRGLLLLLGLLGLGQAVLGGWLLTLGGTPMHLVCGLLLLVAAWLGFRASGRAEAWGAGLAAVIAIGWAVAEIAGKGWMPSWIIDFASRVALVLVLLAAVLAASAMARHRPGHWARRAVGGALAICLLLVGGLVALLWERPEDPARTAVRTPLPANTAEVTNTAENWRAYAGSNLGRHYSPAAQITPANVHQLQEAWSHRSGDTAPNDRVFYSSQNTPLKVGDSLYFCSSSAQVFALDPATGEQRWHYDPATPAGAMESLFSVACRAVGHHGAPGEAACSERIFAATADGRLIALDARLGQPCEGFGTAGVVDLTEGMGLRDPGFASNTSGPAVVGDFIIIGQQVSDNQRRDSPSGVVRAYDARSGALAWAWDAHRPDAQAPLAPGEIYPRGTPNVWNVISADESLGLVFLGTGNSGADHWGGDRTEAEDRFTSAIVAVELATGATRWSYATVQHDLWDYDIGAQPTVLDIPIEGQLRRAVLLGTKTGSLFLFDAATGEALRPIEQRPAPQGATLSAERLSPTQPQSTFYPNFAAHPGPEPERIDARHTFGISPLDAAWCRIQFHQMRYEGIYTPPVAGEHGMLLFPGTIGGINWGGVGVDNGRLIAITNHSRLPNHVVMVPRAEVTDVAVGDGGARPDQEVAPQANTPYGVKRPIWFSPLDMPCIAPPWGYLAATDLASGELLWSRPLGTAFDTGPLGTPLRLRIQVGTPNIGGPLLTASGLTFIAAAQDNYLRAFQTETGRLLWTARLPAGGQASPMTYVHEGRQYVAMVATGHSRLETTTGDHLVVYALAER
ncbi:MULTISPECIES: pyrroloquinoline quinone-dependent dehydrogenase [Roseomonadaceae]|uniref:Pyrroloquinoline quinone-dependent dehydrogenase n=1 Tax=Falsiroseomonas oleicola TaxID=2801474 RepID=A0ABS6HBW5_9PROT|nr:pyrroloquinoline quinone-dependent dehydrogenase [Roseomonas oleicola]MBU8546217.1 pyrroloquinoline quinone-dependent dehydrogenase [Roseomonas oleicola]